MIIFVLVNIFHLHVLQLYVFFQRPLQFSIRFSLYTYSKCLFILFITYSHYTLTQILVILIKNHKKKLATSKYKDSLFTFSIYLLALFSLCCFCVFFYSWFALFHACIRILLWCLFLLFRLRYSYKFIRLHLHS